MNGFNNRFSIDNGINITGDMRMEILRSTYLLLGLSMIPTIIGAIFGVNMSFGFMMSSPIISSLIMIGAMYFLIFMVQKNRYSFAGIAWLMLFTFMMGVFLGPLFQIVLRIPNGVSLISLALFLTASVFFFMSILAFTIKKELTGIGNFLAIGAIVLIIAVVVNIFLRLPVLHLMICGAFVIFSSLMILWQLNQVIRGGETNYISVTLSLYISLYNLFTSLLQIILAFSGQDRR